MVGEGFARSAASLGETPPPQPAEPALSEDEGMPALQESEALRPVTSVTLPVRGLAGYVADRGFCGRVRANAASSKPSQLIPGVGESGESESIPILIVAQFAVQSGGGCCRAVR